MRLMMVSVFDKKALAYTQPDMAAQPGQAIRSFSDAVNNPQSAFNKHPEDYALYNIGYFDDNTGLIFPPMVKDDGGTDVPAPGPVLLQEALNVVITKG